MILAIGIYVQVETGFSDLSLGSVLTSPAIVLIIIGAVLFVVGFCGCFGALLELFPLLLIVSSLLVFTSCHHLVPTVRHYTLHHSPG